MKERWVVSKVYILSHSFIIMEQTIKMQRSKRQRKESNKVTQNNFVLSYYKLDKKGEITIIMVMLIEIFHEQIKMC